MMMPMMPMMPMMFIVIVVMVCRVCCSEGISIDSCGHSGNAKGAERFYKATAADPSVEVAFH